MPALTMRELCRKLTAADRPKLMDRIWANLPEAPRAAVQKTLDAGYDRTTPADKEALAAAMNRITTQPDVIAQADLDAMKIDGATKSLLTNNPDVRARADEVRRRLFIEHAFGDCLDSGAERGAGHAVDDAAVDHAPGADRGVAGGQRLLPVGPAAETQGSRSMKAEATNRDLLLIGGFVGAMTAVNVVLVLTGRAAWGGWWNWQTFGVMVAAALTLALFSQLYSDNALFKAAEHIFVGTSVAYGLGVAWYNMWVSEIFKGLATGAREQQYGIWSIILPGILGLLVYCRLTKRWGWVSRWPFALMIGFGVGYAIPTQIAGKPAQADRADDGQRAERFGGEFRVNWNAIIILIGVLSTLVYFFFSLEHKGVVGGVSKVGIWFLMVAFGHRSATP